MKRMETWLNRLWLALGCLLFPATALAQGSSASGTETIGNTGVSGIWMLANISYAGMRAQGSKRRGWRIAAFIFGLPGTIVTYLAVVDGSGRVYGIEVSVPDNDEDS